MATSFNNMIDGSKLYPGYEFLVRVDTNSENVVLVTGFIGSRKYRGALLSVPLSAIRACVTDNVFSSDFSSKSNYSLSNMSFTNYYSHKKIRNIDGAMFSVNQKCVKENYICANCKMKISYFSKHETKNPGPSNLQKETTANSHSDITVLKQTLSYPDISDDKLPLETNISMSNNSEKPGKSLKRKKESANHVIHEKKSKLSFVEKKTAAQNLMNKQENDQTLANAVKNVQKEDTVKEKPYQDKIDKEKLCMDKVEQGKRYPDRIDQEKHYPDKIDQEKYFPDKINQEISCKDKIDQEKQEIDDNTSEHDDKTDLPQSYEQYRSMPLSLATLNHLHSNDNDRTSDESLNRECPKPKKKWMKMIENEDNQSLVVETSPVCLSSPNKSQPMKHAPIKNSLVKSSPIKNVPTKNSNSVNQSKLGHSNRRNYKIKQTSNDKVILTIDKTSLEGFPDIYTFTEENELSQTANEPTSNLEMSKLVKQELLESKTDESIKSSNSSCSKTSKISKMSKSSKSSSKKNSVLNINNNNNTNNNNNNQSQKIESKNSSSKSSQDAEKSVAPPIKMEPDSTTDGTLFHDNELVSTASTILSCESSSGVSFNLNDIVWAKITGYPFWPGKIISLTREDDSFVGCIEWFAWSEISFIKVNSLFHFSSHFPSKYQKRNRNGKYQEAVKLARDECGMTDDTDNAGSNKGSETDSDSNAASYTSVSL